MNTNNALNHFVNLLQSRTSHLSEDIIRSYFLNSMLQQDPNLDNYCLEYPYSALCPSFLNSNTKLDLYYLNKLSNEIEEICIEVKYHYHFQNSTFSYSRKIAQIIKDLLRLKSISLPNNREQYLLYVVEASIYNHFCNNVCFNFGGFLTSNITNLSITRHNPNSISINNQLCNKTFVDEINIAPNLLTSLVNINLSLTPTPTPNIVTSSNQPYRILLFEVK